MELKEALGQINGDFAPQEHLTMSRNVFDSYKWGLLLASSGRSQEFCQTSSNAQDRSPCQKNPTQIIDNAKVEKLWARYINVYIGVWLMYESIGMVLDYPEKKHEVKSWDNLELSLQ